MKLALLLSVNFALSDSLHNYNIPGSGYAGEQPDDSMIDNVSEPPPSFLGVLEREKTRLLGEAASKIEREMAEIARLALAYPEAFKAIAHQMGLVEVKGQSEVVQSGIETLGDLIESYRTFPVSPFHNLKHYSREHYGTLLDLIKADYANQKLSEADSSTIDALYAKWGEGGKIAAAHSKMVMLRNLFGFGTMSVRDENCARLYGLIGKMKIELPKARTEYLTREQADMIRSKAHEKDRPSIALAQAFQSDLSLLQKDVIGEWVPVSEPGISDIIQGDLKWVRGLRWEEISSKFILTHVAGDKEITLDLKKHPMVMVELERAKVRHGGKFPSSGPIIVSEYDGQPWSPPEFRRWWRLLATECGISTKVRNSDSRVKANAVNAENAPETEDMGKGRF